MEFEDAYAFIHFSLREKLHQQMLLLCNDALKKFVGEIKFNLYRALALNLNNRFSESIKELEVLKSENDIRLASTVALIYTHKKMGNVEKDVFANLEAKLREYRNVATASDWTNAAFVLYTLGKTEKALEYIDRALRINPSTNPLKGWILLKLRKTQDAIYVFEQCLKENKRSLDSTLGLSQAFLHNKNHEEALNVANKAVVRFPSMNIALVNKLIVLFTAQDFDQANETLLRILSTDDNSYTALKIEILIMLCNSSNYEDIALKINAFVDLLERLESKNGEILATNGFLFSRLCNRNKQILAETYNMLEKSVYLSSDNVNNLIEFGYQCILQGKIKEAIKYFKTASKSDKTSFDALLGMTLCEFLENGKSEQIKQQLFFLLELQENHENHPLLLFMRAKLSENADSSIKFLEETIAEQLKNVTPLAFGEEYLRLLDADFLLGVIKVYIEYAPKISSKKSLDKPDNIIVNSLKSLKVLTKACPGLLEAQYLYGKIQFLNSDYSDAMATLNFIIERDPTLTDAQLLIAQIHLNNSSYERASQCLEVALSHNFKVRESPFYHLIQGLIEKQRNNWDESIKSLTTALSLTKIRDVSADKATIYVELIDSYTKANQNHEASNLIEQAMAEFQKTPEESRMMILSADYAAKMGNVQKAIDVLTKVNPNESYYLKAKTQLAETYLVYRQDKKAFMACYNEMVQFNPGPESFLLLGDAYMRILEPDKALEAYNNALQMNPSDPYLTSKMGKALIDTHYYKKAVVFYKDAISSTANPDLKLQLAELYMQLKEFEMSEVLITGELENSKKDDLLSLQYRTKLYKLLAEVKERAGNVKGAMDVLKSARDNQNRVRKILAVEQAVIPVEEVNCLIQLNMKLGELASGFRDHEKAINHYKDALTVSNDNPKILAALAKLYMQINYLELCQQTCANLLKLDADNEIASVLMADIAFRKVDFDMSVFHFTQLVNKQPTNWAALVRLVEVLRRTGNLDEVSQYLQLAEKQLDRPQKEPGFCFCTALYQWYSGNLNGALRNFNNARQDSEWGQEAIYNMIEICLNPEDEVLGEQFMDSDDLEYRDSRSMALKTADRLLKELKQKVVHSMGDDELKCRLLENFLLIASKDKSNVEQALEDFISIGSMEAYKDHVGPILGMAMAYSLLKQGQRAKTQLKRVIKNIWTFEEADYIERCWLLLADYYLQSNKYELAADLLKKVLQHNKACCKAYEFSGYIAEKEQKYKEAANHYEAAWKNNGRNNPAIGYKLAYNLMKCKRYADAIDVGQMVYKNHPEYMRIKKDVLDKSINNLRT